MVDGDVEGKGLNSLRLLPTTTPKPRLPSHAFWFSSREVLSQHKHCNFQQILSEDFQTITISIHVIENKYSLKYVEFSLRLYDFPWSHCHAQRSSARKAKSFTPPSKVPLITIWLYQGLANNSKRPLFFPSSLITFFDMASHTHLYKQKDQKRTHNCLVYRNCSTVKSNVLPLLLEGGKKKVI